MLGQDCASPQCVLLSLCQHEVARSAFAEVSSKLGYISSAAGLLQHSFFFFKVLIPKLYFKKGGKKTKRLQLKQSYSFLEFNKSCVSVN